MAIARTQLRTTGVYASQGPLDALLDGLGEIEQACRKWKAYRKKMVWFGVLLLFGGMACLVLLNEFPFLILAGILAIAAAVGCFVYAYRYARKVLGHTDRCATVRGIADSLRDDTHAKAPAAVKLSFTDEHRISKGERPFPQRKKGKQRFFEDEWLSLENTFLDGTVMTERVTDLVRIRSYVNPRGKWKSKTRLHHVVALRMRYPDAVYGDASLLPVDIHGLVKLPSTASLHEVSVSGTAVKLKATVRSSSDLVRTSKMLQLGAYRILNLSRKRTARQRATKGGGQ